MCAARKFSSEEVEIENLRARNVKISYRSTAEPMSARRTFPPELSKSKARAARRQRRQRQGTQSERQNRHSSGQPCSRKVANQRRKPAEIFRQTVSTSIEQRHDRVKRRNYQLRADGQRERRENRKLKRFERRHCRKAETKRALIPTVYRSAE